MNACCCGNFLEFSFWLCVICYLGVWDGAGCVSRARVVLFSSLGKRSI